MTLSDPLSEFTCVACKVLLNPELVGVITSGHVTKNYCHILKPFCCTQTSLPFVELEHREFGGCLFDMQKCNKFEYMFLQVVPCGNTF